MRFNSKCYEERRVVLDEKERDLIGDCANLISSLMDDFDEMDLGVTLPSLDDDGDDCEYPDHEFYNALWDVNQLLSNLQMRGVVVGRGKVKKK